MTFERVAGKLHPQSELLRSWTLKGGVSAQVTALEVRHPDGGTNKLVVRQHGAVDLRQNPQVAASEFKLLQLLHAEGVLAPAPCYVDQSGEVLPTPYIVVEYVEGTAEFAPPNLPDFILQLATHLAGIHRIQGAAVSFLPKQEQVVAQRLKGCPDESLRGALESVWPLPQRNQPVLLHGDFWPGNILWRDGRLVAVIDWEDAAVGDPLADVSNTRLELLWAFGTHAMALFTQQYQAMAAVDSADLPYWDLCAALRPAAGLAGWGLDALTEGRMREGLQWFVAQALARLTVRREANT
ncbi:MAG TPA: phosphotransferase [Symbiobacteriaceae bacterium]|nr:phosphotransferase [Symbiobacteriaceae bacterium]